MNSQQKIHYWGNAFGLIVICCLLIIAFVDQIINYDLPCPLCLLQRVSFVGIGICFMLNLYSGIRPSHYGFMLLQTLIGLAISTRQIYFHLGTNSPGYGNSILGLYFYTWAAIIFTIIILCIAIALIFDHGFDEQYTVSSKFLTIVIALFLFLILANGISTVLECGFNSCPGNPTYYYLLK